MDDAAIDRAIAALPAADAAALADLAKHSAEPHIQEFWNGYIGFDDPEIQRWKRLCRLGLVEHCPVRDVGTCGRAWWRPTDAAVRGLARRAAHDGEATT